MTVRFRDEAERQGRARELQGQINNTTSSNEDLKARLPRGATPNTESEPTTSTTSADQRDGELVTYGQWKAYGDSTRHRVHTRGGHHKGMCQVEKSSASAWQECVMVIRTARSDQAPYQAPYQNTSPGLSG